MVRYLKTRTKQRKSRTKHRKSRSLKKKRTKQRKSRSLKKNQKRKTSKKKNYRGGSNHLDELKEKEKELEEAQGKEKCYKTVLDSLKKGLGDDLCRDRPESDQLCKQIDFANINYLNAFANSAITKVELDYIMNEGYNVNELQGARLMIKNANDKLKEVSLKHSTDPRLDQSKQELEKFSKRYSMLVNEIISDKYIREPILENPKSENEIHGLTDPLLNLVQPPF